eukprot:10449074-Ditylum_brightwellii.AAC.1
MLDTGDTNAVTPCKDDFVSFKSNHKEKRVIKGIAKGLKFEGSVIVEYQFNVDDGSEVVLKCKAFYVPAMHMRLLSPQDAGTSSGNPIKFSTFSPFYGKKEYARLEVKPITDGWED